MTIATKGGIGPVFRNWELADRPTFAAYFVYYEEEVNGDFSENITIDDANFSRETDATYTLAGYISTVDMVSPVITNFNPEVCTIGTDLAISRHTSGIAKILVTSLNISLPLTLDLRTVLAGSPIDRYLSPVSGSLAATLISESATRLTGSPTQAANGSLYTDQDHDSPYYVRNTNVWCADVAQKLTCISPWNSRLSGAGYKVGNTLVTPRHILSAEHYRVEIGNIVRFVAVNGTVYDRTVVGKATHPDYDYLYPDFRILTLDSNLPSAITPCTIMPVGWDDHMVNLLQNNPPMLVTDQEEKALITDLRAHAGNRLSFSYPVDATRLLFSENLIGGDSGNAVFAIIDGNLVFMTALTGGGAGSGTSASDFHSDLNAMIVTSDTVAGVSTGYTVTAADLSAYPDYS
jgi:hypothetical protein